MTNYWYEEIAHRTRDRIMVENFDEQQCELFEAYFRFIDLTGLDWDLLQLKTKFGGLRCYVRGDEKVQKLARNLEVLWDGLNDSDL